MATGGPPVERLRGYLSQLPTAKRTQLIAELESALLRGDEVPGGDLLLQEVRSSVRESAQRAPRISQAARLFFRPLEPFLVEDQSGQKQLARLARSTLPQLWDWICRDVLPDVGNRFSDAVTHALNDGGAAMCGHLIRPFQDQVAERIRAMLGESELDDKVRRRMIGQIGLPQALEVARDLLAILGGRDTLAAIASRLPGHIGNLADGQLEQIKLILDTCTAEAGELLPFALILLGGRLASPWQLIRLAVRAAESDAAARIASTSYSIAVTVTLADIEQKVGELKVDLKRGQHIAVISLLKYIHDAVRGIRSELDLGHDSPWGRQLAAIRSEVSSALKTEIESTPGRVRRLLRPRAPGKSVGARLDAGDVAETEALIELLGACRNYASELAISEVTLLAHSELEQYLESGPRTLVEGLRGADPADRAFRQLQIEAAVRFCAKVFGPQYAAVLVKAAEVAVNSERKVTAKA
ncbi:MAG TPA: hypothetical protein VKW08_12815 [Xanthobacteraceae bacterium]|nr:hypothetical protein [Xanthobacteraceae bacterium]